MIDHAKIKNILVIRPDAIGDLVLTLPAIQALRENFPSARITALIRAYTRPVLDCSSAVDNIIYGYDIKRYGFDLSVNYFNQFKDTFATYSAGIPQRLGDSSRVLTAWMNNLKVFRDWNDFTRHEVEFNLDLLAPLGIKSQQVKPLLKPTPAALTKANQLIGNDRYFGIHVGSATSKSWDEKGFAELAAWLAGKGKVALLGGPAEIAKGENVAKLAKVPLLNLVGKIELAELIALISRLEFFVGMDTGATHLAAAFGKPLVMICLNKKAKPLRWGPWQTRHLVAVPAGDELAAGEVITAVGTVLKGGGVSTREDSLYHWAERSLGIAIIHDDNNLMRAVKVSNLLTAGGFRNYVTKESGIRPLLDFFVKNDTLVIHRIGKAGGFAPFIAQQLTGSYMASRAVLFNDPGREYKDSKELIGFYFGRARNGK